MRYQAAPRPEEGSVYRRLRPVRLRTCVRMEEFRRCGRCGQLKAVAQFAWRRKARGQRHNMCRPCHAEYHREHYLANKERYVDQARERKQLLNRVRTAYLLDFFSSNPCADCGNPTPWFSSSTTWTPCRSGS